MASAFVRLLDDLAYAKTFYPHGHVTGFVNGLAKKIYLAIYRNKIEEQNRLKKFVLHDVPLALARRRHYMFFSLFIFALFYAIGFFSSSHDPQFISDVLGPGYVAQTEQNIRDGNPFGIYQGSQPFAMWLGITVNNVAVSFVACLKGILLGVWSIIYLINNSIMVGVFHYEFFRSGYGGRFVLAVMIHGFIELTSLVLVCGAGIVLGTGFLFPGTGSRIQAWKESAKDALKILIGLIPCFMIAAFFESYVTRHYKMPLVLNLLVLGISVAFIILYFI